MPSEFEWSGSSLRGSLGSLKKGGWHLVGSSPSALSPCETSSWDIGLFGQTPGHFDSSKGPFRLCRQSEFPVNHGPCKIRITDTNRLTPTSPAPLVFILSPSDFTHMDNRCAIVKLGPGLAAHLAANSTLELEVLAKGEAAVLTSAEEPNPRPATTYVTDLVLSPLPFDVRFSFPRSGQDLWANSSKLRTASKYFADILDSGFRESEAEVVAYPGTSTSAASASDPGWSDSDDDGPPLATPAKPQQRVYTITVTNHSFNTYHALLIWLYDGFITFDQLHSPETTGASSSATSVPPPAKRAKANATDTPAASEKPPAVSPKSIYRLAHLLELDSLREEALGAFKAALTVDNVARQLFSTTADLYDDVRAAAAEYAAEHWDEVAQTAGMKQMRAHIEGREVYHGGVALLAVADALAAKGKKV